MLIMEKEGSERYSLPLSRREIIGLGATTLFAYLVNPFSSPAYAQQQNKVNFRSAKAKSVIQIWLWGGPSHIDTFDPKPEAGNDYAGPLKAIETNVKGIQISELLPLLAKQADKYSLIRSMTHGNNGHETAAYMVQTGRKSGERTIYPCTGAVVSLFKGYDAGYKELIPPYIVLTESQGRFPEQGFLQAKYKPFATGGDPSAQKFLVEGIVAQGITDQQQKDRRELLDKLGSFERIIPDNRIVKEVLKSRSDAYDMILGDGAKVFDLSTEKTELRDAYGRNKFGQSCLMARRLAEKGVPYTTINFGGWDTHKDNFAAMRRLLPTLDKGLATLLDDLKQRGLLESTLVCCYGEFGRTPKVDWGSPWNGGRGHYGKVFSVLVAGGGFKGGQVVGSSDEKGAEVKTRPVYPQDLIGSMYTLMGIDTNSKLPHPLGEDVTILPKAEESIGAAGILKEIM
jgi:hypothetical protein